MKSRKPTSHDIAYLAGVSQATVSRALRDSGLVSKATRERVQRIARQLNYRVDRNAANLRSQRTQTLALLLFEDPIADESNINPFFLSMLGSITRAASRRGYDLLVSFQQLSDDWYKDYEVANRADGLILLGYGDYVRYSQRLVELSRAEAHFVIWGPVTEDQPGHHLGSDNETGARMAVDHLLEHGRRRIAFIGEKAASVPEFQLRHEGYRTALEAAGIEYDEALQVDCPNQSGAGGKAVRELQRLRAQPDAIFAVSDLLAIGALQELERQGIDVPEKVAVVGFDDIPAASYVNPPLTTVRQDTVLAGDKLVDKLVALIEGKTVESEELPLHLVVRQSCGA